MRALTVRRFVAVIAVAAVSVGCSYRDGKPDDVRTSSTELKADDFDSRPPGGGPRPAQAGTVVASAEATHPFSVESASVEEEFVNATARDRDKVSAPPVLRDATLDAYARVHAAAMAASGRIYHSDIRSLLGLWWYVGENVGVGANAGLIQSAYEASPSHFRNLTNETFTHMGVGVFIDTDNRIWTVSDFAA